MTATPTRAWSPIDLVGPARQGDAPALADAFHGLLDQPDASLRERVGQLARAEHMLGPESQRLSVATRLGAWLLLSVEDARIIARAFVAAQESEGEAFVRGARARELQAIMDGFSAQDFERLTRILPWLREVEGAELIRGAVAGA